MGIFTQIEEGISNIIEAPFSHSGGIDIAAIEIALKRLIEREKETIFGRIVIPHCYSIIIEEGLYDEYKSFLSTFASTLSESLSKWAKEKGYTMQDKIHLHFKRGIGKKHFMVTVGDSNEECSNQNILYSGGENEIYGDLVFTKTGEIYKICKPSIVIGRSNTCDIQLEDMAVSRRHAHIYFMAGEVIIEDIGRKSGIRVNRQKISKRILKDGDKIKIGCVEVKIFIKEGKSRIKSE